MAFNDAKEHLTEDGVAILTSEKHRLYKLTTSQNLASGALSYTTSISDQFKIVQVLVHADANISETVTVTYDSVTGANYDTKLGAADFDGTSNVGLLAGENMLGATCLEGDEIKVECTRVGLTGTVYVTIIYQLLS